MLGSALFRRLRSSRKLTEIANAAEAMQDGRIHIEKINEPFLYREGRSPAEYGAGMRRAIERGWLWMHERGTYVKFTPAGAERFASVPARGGLNS